MRNLLLLALLLPAVACGTTSPAASPDGGSNTMSDAGASSPDAASGTDASPNGADAAADSPDATPLLPNIAEAAACQRLPASYHPYHIDEASADPTKNLQRVTVDVAAHPEAVCNDGTPAVYYVRPGSGAGASRWLIHLQGGGSCGSPDACYERWCSIQTSYNASKMSTAWAPNAMKGEGLFAQRSDNSFANWNHVFVYYCSSDSWSGRASDTQVPANGYAGYTAQFQGHNIVAATLAGLKSGAASDDTTRTMPSLNAATAVLLSGTSAGSGGVRANADWVGAQLRSTNPDVGFRAVLDAALSPDQQDYIPAGEYTAMMTSRNMWATLARDAHVDQSCLDYHGPLGNTEVCENRVHLGRHHISTPMFIRMDLRDKNPQPWLNPVTGASLGTEDDFAVAVESQLQWIAKLGTADSEAEEPDAVTVTPGIFGPQCGSHGGILAARVFNHTLNEGNTSYSTHDLLVNWALGNTPSQLIDDPTAKATVCD